MKHFILLLCFCSLQTAFAQSTWINTGSANWFSAGNWSPAAVPNSGGSVTIDNSGTAVIATSGTLNETATFGNSVDGNLIIENGAVLYQNGGLSNDYIGRNAGSNGSILITGNGSGLVNTTTATTYVGYIGSGSLTIQNGAAVSLSSPLTLGFQPGSVGIVTVSGSNSTLTVSNGNFAKISVGGDGISSSGTGIFSVLNGGSASTSYGIAVGPASVATISGSRSTFKTGFFNEAAGGSILVTNGGSVISGGESLLGALLVDGSASSISAYSFNFGGNAVIQNGAKITSTSSSNFYRGTLTVTGSSQWNSSDGFMVGSTSMMTITNGGSVTDTAVSLDGTVSVDGKNSFWKNSDDLAVGVDPESSGTLAITNGGNVSSLNGYVYYGFVTISGSNSSWSAGNIFSIGVEEWDNTELSTLSIQNGGSLTDKIGYIGDQYPGAATIDGTGSIWVSGTNLFIGNHSAGSLVVENGGAVEADGGSTGSGTGVINIGYLYRSSGTLQIGNGGASGIVASGSIVFGSGSGALIFDHTDAAYQFSPGISGTGIILQEGAGTTILTANNSTFTGTTNITAGGLLVKGTLGNSSSSVRVNSSGTLGGSGAIGGAITLNSNGVLMPGGDGGDLNLNGVSLTWNGGGVLDIGLGSLSSELILSGAFTKGSAGTYTFNFYNSGILTSGTYTLVTYSSTNFTAPNFTYTTSIPSFSGSFVTTGTSVAFAVAPQVPIHGAPFAMLALGLAGMIMLARHRHSHL